MSKFIFFDVDGVLNCDSTTALLPDGNTSVDGRLIQKLGEIVRATGARLVISSDWRLPDNRDALIELCAELAIYGLVIENHTPIIGDGTNREEEIKLFLQNQQTDNFVILDDYYSFPSMREHFVRTNRHNGLTRKDVEKAIAILNAQFDFF